MTLRTRLLLVGVAPVAVLVLALVLVGALLDRALREGVDRALRAQAAVEAVSLFDRLGHVGHLHLDRSPLRVEAGDSPAWGALYGPDGRRILSVPEGAPMPERVSPPPLGAPARIRTEPGLRPPGQRVLMVSVRSPEGAVHTLRLATPLDRSRETMASYVKLAAAVGVVAALALLLAHRALLRSLHRRIADLGAHMARVGRGDLSGEPAPDGARDELASLRDAVAGATTELRRARAVRERLIADAAHELRTPLAAIRTDVDVTLRRERGPDELRETLARVREEVVRLGTLSQQLLDLAAQGSRPHVAAEGELADAVAAAVAAMRGVAAERGVALVAEGSARGRFDADAMQQVLRNLVDNAVGVSPPGGAVTVRVARVGGALSIAVEDEGPGIPPAERELVFEPFHRLDRRGRGVGLGLAIVRDIARRHGGDATVDPEFARGARLVVRWPATA